ncbi:MAG: hypothetical protein AB7L28_25030, partial [Kofleriaceae bacterium]
MTPRIGLGSQVSTSARWGRVALIISLGCAATAATAQPAAPAPHARELSLGVVDRGIFSDLDPKVQLALPVRAAPDRITATIDPKRSLLIVAVDGFP